MRLRTLAVQPPDAGRLDAFVRRSLPACSRRLTARLIADGVIRVNGRCTAKGASITTGDQVTLPAAIELPPCPTLDLVVLHATPHLLAIDKPAGIPSHALDPREPASVAAWLATHYPETAQVGDPLAAGLAHRLDRGTSGVLLAARNAETYAKLRRSFRDRRVGKRYRAIVEGRTPERIAVDQPLAHDKGMPGRMVPSPEGWAARTQGRRIAQGARFSLVELEMETGVTHQLRAHLAGLGHPIVGDALYGASTHAEAHDRHALHAMQIELMDPQSGEPIHIGSPWPAELELLWQTLAAS